jgi:arginyl-tRNA synthetase
MSDLKSQLKIALEQALTAFALPENQKLEVVIQETPSDKPGDYGSAVAFQLAKALRQNPAQIASSLANTVQLPVGISKAEAVGPYLNFFVDAPAFVQNIASSRYEQPVVKQKVIIEHTSVNPNKEWHVGHIRGALIGDALARIYRASGYTVEVQNYIDDTGRQAAESQFAVQLYGNDYDGTKKYDHWLGEKYVRLHKDYDLKNKEIKASLEPQIAAVIHQLEDGELRGEIERVVKSQLETAASLGIEYDLLTWESDVVHAGLVEQALAIFADKLESPTEGKYAGAKGVDLSPFVAGLEEPFKVLVRGNGTYVYETKDIAYHYWKFGLFEGLRFQKFSDQHGKPLYTTAPNGELHPDGQSFAHGNQVINVIDSRQGLAQIVVKAGLSLVSDGSYAKYHHHLANETVLLEGQTMSGRKGITVSADEVIAEAKARALELTTEKKFSDVDEKTEKYGQAFADSAKERMDEIAPKVGMGALKFAFLKIEPKRQIDFRWDQALSLQGDTAPFIQYAYVRARKVLLRGLAGELTEMAGKVEFENTLETAIDKWRTDADWKQVSSLELDLMKLVARYEEIIKLCIRENSPHPMCTFALEVASAFNGYYNHRDLTGKNDTNVLYSPSGLREARLAVVARVADAIQEALGVLGIEAPSEM